ncbi:unnamed protein product [Parnassius mnemosyne]|uniref:Transposase n=1 Tax=Parnassius mnemosyne TaxID=213953 RepID=A0AAV1KU67_9NEOP
MFTRSPDKSIRQAARVSGLTRHTVMTALKTVSSRPWKPHYCQEITPEECDLWVECGEIMLGWRGDRSELFDNIVWTDEAIFHVRGFVNRHNCHYWAELDLKATAEKMKNRPKVTIWCGMTSSQVIGPFLLREIMNGERYLNILENRVQSALLTFDNIENMVFWKMELHHTLHQMSDSDWITASQVRTSRLATFFCGVGQRIKSIVQNLPLMMNWK